MDSEKPAFEERFVLDSKDDLITNIAVSPDARLLACGVENKTRLYTLDEECSRYEIRAFFSKLSVEFKLEFQTDFATKNSFQNVVLFSPDGRVITGGEQGLVRVWQLSDDYQEANEQFCLNGHTDYINAMDVHPSEAMVGAQHAL